MITTEVARQRERLGLARDCSNCFALCCVALTFRRVDGFPYDKLSGSACSHLQGGFSCGIHAELDDRGFHGCTTYDCLGAGQKISRQFAGRDWRESPESAQRLYQSLPAMREVHLLLWYLTEAIARTPAGPLAELLQIVGTETQIMADSPAAELSWGEVDRHGSQVLELLIAASESIRRHTSRPPRSSSGVTGRSQRRGADLQGADLHGADLRGRDLREADLRCTDLRDADLRGADLAGADLTDALFLTQGQLNSARGDASTRLSSVGVVAPGHWRSP